MISDKPRCKKQFSIIGVSEDNNNLTIDCNVESLPEIVHFSWSVNSSNGLKILQRDKVKIIVAILHFYSLFSIN